MRSVVLRWTRHAARTSCGFVIGVLWTCWAVPGSLCAGEPAAQTSVEVPDFTKATLAEFGLKPVAARRDERTGFVVGGRNDTKAIPRVTEFNGRSIADLERDMRPGKESTKGFLGEDERLLDVLAADNKYVVDECRLTHQELARHLRLLAAIGGKHPDREFLYHGSRFRVTLRSYRGYQDSPFGDGTKANSEAVLKNVSNGKSLEYSLLVPDMIERYGFYEGRGTPYRVDPEQVRRVLDFLPGSPK